jgi:regulatory protein
MFKKQIKKEYSADAVLAKMEHFCAFQERSPHEVRSELQRYTLDKKTGETIYASLETDGFFNEERFADSFARGKFRVSHWGRIRIRMELKMRRVEPALIEAALDKIDQEAYVEQLRQMAAKKLGQYGDDPRARDKTAAALLRAGYEPDLVFKNL